MKSLFVTLMYLVVAPVVAQASVTLEIDAGYLRNQQPVGSTSTPTPVMKGGLLQLIASPSGSAANFAAPTANSFTGGDNIVVASFAMNYSGGSTPETDNVVTFTLQNTTSTSSSTTFDAGDPLLLRWYPTLTYNSSTNYSTTGPGSGITYGQGRTDVAVDMGTAWITPSNGSTTAVLTFITSDDSGGSQLMASGYANFTTVSVGVPEPSAGLLCGVGLVIAVGARQTMRRLKVVQ